MTQKPGLSEAVQLIKSELEKKIANPGLFEALQLVQDELNKKMENTSEKKEFLTIIAERLKHAEEVISHNTLVIENIKKILVGEDEKQPDKNHNTFVKEQVISADNTLTYWILCRDIYKSFL